MAFSVEYRLQNMASEVLTLMSSTIFLRSGQFSGPGDVIVMVGDGFRGFVEQRHTN